MENSTVFIGLKYIGFLQRFSEHNWETNSPYPFRGEKYGSSACQIFLTKWIILLVAPNVTHIVTLIFETQSIILKLPPNTDLQNVIFWTQTGFQAKILTPKNALYLTILNWQLKWQNINKYIKIIKNSLSKNYFFTTKKDHAISGNFTLKDLKIVR